MLIHLARFLLATVVMIGCAATVSPLTVDPAVEQVEPAGTVTPGAPLTPHLPLPTDEQTTWYLPGLPHVDGMRLSMVEVLAANELEFLLGEPAYPVQGFSPDPIYPRLFIRDTSTLMRGAGYFYPPERLTWAVESFLRQQYTEGTVSDEDGWPAGWGAISATVGPDGIIDKATNVSDEETHLIHAAYVIYDTYEGTEWLSRDINGQRVMDRLNAAGEWLLSHRQDAATGLIIREHTTDWGDVRFQPTTGNPTDIVADDVVWTASIYDQALAYRAWQELAVMNLNLGDQSIAERWKTEAEKLQTASNTYLWQPERGFYRTHWHITPLDHDFDEDGMVSIANAVAVRSGLPDENQTAQIITALEQARVQAGSRKPGVVLYPPYPNGFFAIPRMHFGGAYQNGGVWDWWGAWQVLAEFENGYSRLGRAHLLQTAADWAFHPGYIYEWQEVNSLTGQGGEWYAGAAGMYAQVIIEGLYGIKLSLAGPALSPRLGQWPGSIVVRRPGHNVYLRYSYRPTADTLTLEYDTNAPQNFPLQLLLPPYFSPERVFLNGTFVEWELVELAQDQYLNTTLPTGHHVLVVER